MQDCEGSYSPCDVSCEKVYAVTAPASASGVACETVAGAVETCAEGEGACPSNVTVSGAIILDASLEDIDQVAFDAAFIDSLAAAFGDGVDASAVVITGVTGASVRVAYTVTLPCGGDCAGVRATAETANEALIETAEAGGFTVTGLGIASAIAEPPQPEPEPDTSLEDKQTSMGTIFGIVVSTLIVVVCCAAG